MKHAHHSTNQLFRTILMVVLSVFTLSSTYAQPDTLDPSDMFFTAYNYEKDGKALLDQKKFDKAAQKFVNAQKLLNTIHTRFPYWETNIVKRAHTRVTQLIKTVDDLKKKEEQAKIDVPKLYQEPSNTPRLDEFKRKTALTLQKGQKLETAAERANKIEKELNAKKQELEKQKLAMADKAELLRVIREKDAELAKLSDTNKNKTLSATQREKLLKEEVTSLRKQLAQSFNNPTLQSAEAKEHEAEIAALRQQVQSHESERAALAQTNADQAVITERNQQEITELKAAIKKSTERLENETRESNRKINEINRSLTSLQRQKEEAENKLKRASLEKSSTSTLPTGYSESDAKMIEKLRVDTANIEAKRQALLEQKKTEIAAVEKRESTLKEEVASSQEKLKLAETALQEAQAKTQLKNEELKKLQRKLETLVTQERASQDQILSQTDQITTLEDDIQALKQERDLLLMRPLKTEVLALKEELGTLKTEKQGLSTALATNEEKYYEAVDRIEELQKKLEETRGVTSDFEKNVETEREISNEIIKTQRQRHAALQSTLNDTQRALATEQKKANNLQQLLNETTEQYAELESRHDALIAEHEHLQTLIDGKSDNNLLRQQHLKMKSELTAAQNAYKALLEQENTREQDLAMARKQYTIAQADLNKARHQLELSNMRSDKLRNQLVKAQSELQLAETNPSSERSQSEIKLLRDLVDRQLKLQKNRQLARSIILEQVKRLDIDDTEFINALNLSETQELVLSKEQKELLANPDADSEFRFTDRATPEEREQAEAELTQKLELFDRMGREAFEKERYAAAEEFFKLNLDAHPGHVPSMLNLGVLQLRHARNAGDPSSIPDAIETLEDAIAMSGDQSIPYAHQMLGYAHYLTQNFEEANVQFELTLDQDPTNANAHILLADIAGENNNLKSTESHLKSAIEIDPTMSEPHYNLAQLYFYQGKYKESLKQYRTALRKGASPDAQLEAKLQEALPADSF